MKKRDGFLLLAVNAVFECVCVKSKSESNALPSPMSGSPLNDPSKKCSRVGAGAVGFLIL